MGIKSKIVSKITGRGAGKLTKIMRKSGKKKKPTEVESARKDPITGGSVKIAREVDAGKAGKVNKGKSISFTEEMQNASSRKRAKEYVRIERKEGSDRTASEKKFFADYRRTELDRSRRAASASSKTQRAKNKNPKLDPPETKLTQRSRKNTTTDDMGNSKTGEFTSKTTANRIKQLGDNADVRAKVAADRRKDKRTRARNTREMKRRK